MTEVQSEEVQMAALHNSIGAFIYAFSQLEFTISTILGKALGLSEEIFDVITAPYDFALLCNITNKVMAHHEIDESRKKTYEKIFKDCQSVNTERVRVVHSLWNVDRIGISARHFSRNKLKADRYFEEPHAIDKWTSKINDIHRRILFTWNNGQPINPHPKSTD